MSSKNAHTISQGVLEKTTESFIGIFFYCSLSLKLALFSLPLRLFELQILMSFELCSLIKVGQKTHATYNCGPEI